MVKRVTWLICTFLLSCVFNIPLWAQTTATIAGRLADSRTGEALVGATLIVVGTQRGAATDIDGKFSFTTEPGTYQIEARSIGYKPKRVENVTVAAGQTQLLTLTLESTDFEVQEVEVVANAAKNNDNSLLADQHAAAGVSSGVSAELLARTPDRSMAESLRRISGTSVRDGRFAVVRGLQERYNQGQVNGMAQPSTEPDRKAFALDLFPTALVDRITVYKTGTPDLPGDFAGGVVRVNTVDIPFANTFSVSASAEHQSITTGRTFLKGTTSPTDWLGMDDGRRSLPGGTYTGSQTNPGTQDVANQTRAQNNDFAPTRTGPAGPNLYFQAFLGRRGTLFGKQAGMVLGLNYYRTLQADNFSNFVAGGSSMLDSATGTRRIVDYTQLTQRRYRTVASASLLANFSIRPDAQSKVAFRNMLVQTGTDLYIQGQGNTVEGSGTKNTERRTYVNFFDQNRLSTHQLSYERALGTGGAKVEALAGASFLRRETPDFKRLIYDRSRQGTDSAYGPYQAVLSLPSARVFNPLLSGKFFSTMMENSYNGTLNGALPVTVASVKSVLKAGGSYQWRTRSYQGRNFLYVKSDQSPGSDQLARIVTQGPDSIFRDANLGGGLVYLRETTNASDFYHASARLSAAYLMSETSIGARSRLIYGVRVEQYRQQVQSVSIDGQPFDATSTVTDWLPSVNGQWGLTDNLTLRGAYFSSVNRPEFRELSPSIFYDAALNATVFGNPNLVRARIHNFDLKLEFYPQDGAVFSLNGFYKRMDHPIEQSRDKAASFPTYTFINTSQGRVAGLEAELRSTLGFIYGSTAEGEARRSGFLTDLTLFANGALIYSQVTIPGSEGFTRPLQGQSPYTLNAGASYTYRPLNLDGTLTVSRTGTRIAYVGDTYESCIWEAPRTIIDASVTYRRNRLTLKGTVGDLLAQNQVFFQIDGANIGPGSRRDFLGTPIYKKGTDIPFYNITYGRTLRLTAGWTF